jgi:ABC-type branched-subunit amino acid transport system ATPase component
VVDGLVKRFAGVVALDRVDFVVEQRTVFGRGFIARTWRYHRTA